eukprot:scaffold33436_cov54-Phaeocystis_antarctica.AAC.6
MPAAPCLPPPLALCVLGTEAATSATNSTIKVRGASPHTHHTRARLTPAPPLTPITPTTHLAAHRSQLRHAWCRVRMRPPAANHLCR